MNGYQFLDQEIELLRLNVSEQAISNRLARLFEQQFSEWHVDCEYNRNAYEIKCLKYALVPNGNIEERAVVPDIIVHLRRSEENLIAIEIKKDVNKENRFKDNAKLTAFREQLGYKHTIFIDFGTGDNAGIKEFTLV